MPLFATICDFLFAAIVLLLIIDAELMSRVSSYLDCDHSEIVTNKTYTIWTRIAEDMWNFVRIDFLIKNEFEQMRAERVWSLHTKSED